MPVLSAALFAVGQGFGNLPIPPGLPLVPPLRHSSGTPFILYCPPDPLLQLLVALPFHTRCILFEQIHHPFQGLVGQRPQVTCMVTALRFWEFCPKRQKDAVVVTPQASLTSAIYAHIRQAWEKDRGQEAVVNTGGHTAYRPCYPSHTLFSCVEQS
ncbi:hypothetical protein MTO96_047161 [Rhipicephalus appendiculatus]